MPVTPTLLNIDLYATTKEDFRAHLESSFCRRQTFEPHIPNLRWTYYRDGFFSDFDQTYQEYKAKNYKRFQGSGILFSEFDYGQITGSIEPWVSWEFLGYGRAPSLVSQICHTISVTHYRTDRLRVVLRKGREFTRRKQQITDDNGLFKTIFQEWVEARWGKAGNNDGDGYKMLDLKDAPDPMLGNSFPWRENGKPVTPERFKGIVERKEIDPTTNEGAAAALTWAKEYQSMFGRNALNITRDIEVLTGVLYKTLADRASKWKTRITHLEGVRTIPE